MTDAEIDLVEAAVRFDEADTRENWGAFRSAVAAVRAERVTEEKRTAHEQALLASLRAQHEVSRTQKGIPLGLAQVLYDRAEKQVEAEMKARGDL